MSMLPRLSALLLKRVRAHCDIPCGVYDPGEAQIAAHSVARFLQQIDELNNAGDESPETQATLVRMVSEKEKHARAVKDAIVVIWGDYFKQNHFAAFPGLHDLTHQIMRCASACKQGLAIENGNELVSLVNEFAAIFWQTKDIPTVTVTAPFKPGLDWVQPKLSD